ncbi:hypothetical protein PFICI_07067 [Pestalotiopsis fici W106-1]|uniref:Infection structure specific protein n=1 Tax=Pestalotiopsis fici (strain W106-1 / CGMCC3.15140) TaxID=1229662 RepID=W3X7N3_PESFW|nr:uncharacterized protein PFICI_07067 [Pestalotiopsis fici W106-1]ETS82065.1 hypothetical protein PFICI_07067 [Pestalotiopsis fici W106-1]
MFWRNTHVVLFGVASAAAAHLPPRPADAVRDIAPRQTDSTLSQLLDFANDLGLTACIPQALPLAAELPTIPSGLLNNDLFSQALSQTTLALSDVCQFSITGSDGPKFTSFLPEVYSWYDEHSSQVASIVSGCPSASPLVQTVEAYGACSQVTGGAQLPASITSPGDLSSSGSDALSIQTDTETFSIETDTVISDSTLSITEPTASATTESDTTSSGSASATETATESSSSSSVSQAQAPRETGFVVAAAAMAGFIGAVAAM